MYITGCICYVMGDIIVDNNGQCRTAPPFHYILQFLKTREINSAAFTIENFHCLIGCLLELDHVHTYILSPVRMHRCR